MEHPASDEPRRVGLGRLGDVDLGVERPRNALYRHERLDEQPVADRHRDARVVHDAQEADGEAADVTRWRRQRASHELGHLAADLGLQVLGHDQSQLRRVLERAVGVAVDGRGQYLGDRDALLGSRGAGDTEVQVADTAVGRDEQVRGVKVGVEAAQLEHLPQEHRRAVLGEDAPVDPALGGFAELG